MVRLFKLRPPRAGRRAGPGPGPGRRASGRPGGHSQGRAGLGGLGGPRAAPAPGRRHPPPLPGPAPGADRARGSRPGREGEREGGQAATRRERGRGGGAWGGGRDVADVADRSDWRDSPPITSIDPTQELTGSDPEIISQEMQCNLFICSQRIIPSSSVLNGTLRIRHVVSYAVISSRSNQFFGLSSIPQRFRSAGHSVPYRSRWRSMTGHIDGSVLNNDSEQATVVVHPGRGRRSGPAAFPPPIRRPAARLGRERG